MTVDLSDIQRAAGLLIGQIERTPFSEARTLGSMFGCSLFLKFENLQFTASFKERGAYVKLAALTAQERARGVIACSAGNHAQGVAYHARRLGIPATIVMPEGTPFNKVRQTRAHGATVVLKGADVADANDVATALATKDNLVFVHPYDDPAIIAGQGTVALEMLQERPDLDALVVPIGGGGLIAGIAIAAKALKPEIEIIGVEAALFPSMYQATHNLKIEAGGQTIAEGIAVRRPGALTRPIVERLVDEIMLADETAIERAVQMLLEIEKTVCEGAGAAGVAALIPRPGRLQNKKVGVVLTGGNIDSRLLSSILMRGLVRAGQLVRLRVEISDSPGQLALIAQLIGAAGGNIVEVYHQRLFHDVPVKMADLDVVVETRDAAHVVEILQMLKEKGFRGQLLSNMAREDTE
ncbi:MAG: threonine ammonia-lyase [Alphaproteobacteria bacterium]